jgi:magnesium chelatase subunit D
MRDRHRDYPFAALVGQEPLKTALLLNAVHPAVGGVLIRGEKGTAKSTAARALADLLPPLRLVADCPFHCSPEDPWPECPHCSDGAERRATESTVPFVELPLGATEDRVLGSLDFERALREGRRSFQPGLLAAAHRGVLYVDEVNLLPDHLVDVLLDAAASGVNTVQREGVSVSHPARFLLIGTMNPEEGDLRPQLLDRFGLMVEVAGPREPGLRAEVVRRRLDFESDPAAFGSRWEGEQRALRERVAAAREQLPKVQLADGLLTLISRLCCELEVDGLRADLALHKSARALAALDGRLAVTLDDVRTAAGFVLPHRRRRRPFEQPGLDRQRLDDCLDALRREGPSEPEAPAREPVVPALALRAGVPLLS